MQTLSQSSEKFKNRQLHRPVGTILQYYETRGRVVLHNYQHCLCERKLYVYWNRYLHLSIEFHAYYQQQGIWSEQHSILKYVSIVDDADVWEYSNVHVDLNMLKPFKCNQKQGHIASSLAVWPFLLY